MWCGGLRGPRGIARVACEWHTCAAEGIHEQQALLTRARRHIRACFAVRRQVMRYKGARVRACLGVPTTGVPAAVGTRSPAARGPQWATRGPAACVCVCVCVCVGIVCACV